MGAVPTGEQGRSLAVLCGPAEQILAKRCLAGAAPADIADADARHGRAPGGEPASGVGVFTAAHSLGIESAGGAEKRGQAGLPV